jgi:hypothetical protein
MSEYVPQIFVVAVIIYGLIEAYFTNGQKIVVSFRGELFFAIATLLILWVGGFFDHIIFLVIGG